MCLIDVQVFKKSQLRPCRFFSGWLAYDPFAQENDALGVTILKGISKQMKYQFYRRKN